MPSCQVGFLERPERIVLIIIGALANRMAPVLWVLAVLSNITVIHRIIHTWTGTREIDRAEKAAAEAAAEQGEEGGGVRRSFRKATVLRQFEAAV